MFPHFAWGLMVCVGSCWDAVADSLRMPCRRSTARSFSGARSHPPPPPPLVLPAFPTCSGFCIDFMSSYADPASLVFMCVDRSSYHITSAEYYYYHLFVLCIHHSKTL